MGLRQLRRRDAELALQRAAEVPLAHAELAGQIGHAAAVERAGGDALRREPREPRDRIHQRPPRRQLGPAAEAGPVARPLGGGGGVEEPPALGIGDPRRAHRPAVDPRRGDPDEEDAVEPASRACTARWQMSAWSMEGI